MGEMSGYFPRRAPLPTGYPAPGASPGPDREDHRIPPITLSPFVHVPVLPTGLTFPCNTLPQGLIVGVRDFGGRLRLLLVAVGTPDYGLKD